MNDRREGKKKKKEKENLPSHLKNSSSVYRPIPVTASSVYRGPFFARANPSSNVQRPSQQKAALINRRPRAQFHMPCNVIRSPVFRRHRCVGANFAVQPVPVAFYASISLCGLKHPHTLSGPASRFSPAPAPKATRSWGCRRRRGLNNLDIDRSGG